jgi:glycerophosphoryl diester phosphodiesterase
MNIELKVYGGSQELARSVADIIEAEGFEQDCVITSLDYGALLEIRSRNPRLKTGLIVAQALGDVSRTDVDFLSVRADYLSNALLRTAHRRGMEVHAWTVNDAAQMTRLIRRGVDNLITSNPPLAVQVREQWEGMNEAERLLVASRLLLGLEP